MQYKVVPMAPKQIVPTKTQYMTFGFEMLTDFAKRLAVRFQKLNNQKLHVIPEIERHRLYGNQPVHLIKAHLWDLADADTRRIVWLDADIIPIRPIPIKPFLAIQPTAFAACRDRLNCNPKLIKNYFNSGFFVADLETRPIFEKLKTATSPDWTRDQTSLNLFVQQTTGWLELPARYNWLQDMGQPPEDCIHWHCAGNKGLLETRWKQIEMIYPIT